MASIAGRPAELWVLQQLLLASEALPPNEQSTAEAQGDELALDLHCHSPVDSSRSYSTSKGQIFSGKRKKQEQLNQVDVAILKELNRDHEDDEDSLFMKSLIPELKRFDARSQAFAKCQIQQLLFKAELEQLLNHIEI